MVGGQFRRCDRCAATMAVAPPPSPPPLCYPAAAAVNVLLLRLLLMLEVEGVLMGLALEVVA